MPDTIPTIRVPLTEGEREALKRAARANHRSLGGQAAVIVSEWLDRERRRRERLEA